MLVAFSGGMDSTVLLHLLANDPAARARGVSALHVDHGLHADSGDWAARCTDAARALGVGIEVVRVRVDAGSGLGREGAAREARLAVFAAALPEGGLLALAHHRDDQAETLLLRALRASGVDALGAMAPLRRFGRGALWRPLLDQPREALASYAIAHGLTWIEDPSNADASLDRNFLRHHVLPLLRERWPHASGALARSARLAREASTLLDAEDAAALARVQGVAPRVLSLAALGALPPARQARVARRWLQAMGVEQPTARAVAWVQRAVDHPNPGQFDCGRVLLRHWRRHLHAGHVMHCIPDDMAQPWDGAAPIPMPHRRGELALVGDAGTLAALAADGPRWTVCARLGGERIVLPGRSHSHGLKRVLQDLGVPPWERTVPLLRAADGAVEAAGDLVLSARFDAWLRARGLGIRWTPPDGPRPPA